MSRRRRNPGLSLDAHLWLDRELIGVTARLHALLEFMDGAYGGAGTDAFLRLIGPAGAVCRLRSWLDQRCYERHGEACMVGPDAHRRRIAARRAGRRS